MPAALNEDEAGRRKRRRVEVIKTLKAACCLAAYKRFGRYLSLNDKGRLYLDRGRVKPADHLDGKVVLSTAARADTIGLAKSPRWIFTKKG